MRTRTEMRILEADNGWSLSVRKIDMATGKLEGCASLVVCQSPIILAGHVEAAAQEAKEATE